MKVIKGTLRNGDYFEYEINGKTHWVQGELFYNKKKERFEHIHWGPRNGMTKIVWYN